MNTIVLGIDFKDNTLKLCKEAVQYAHKLNSSITLVHAVEYIPYYPYFPYDQDKIDTFHDSHISWQMSQLESYLKLHNGRFNKSIVRRGNTHEVLCQTAEEINASAILIGVGEHFLFDQLIGSTTEKVSRMARQKVIILNHNGNFKLKKVMCAYDFSANSQLALESAVRFCMFFKSELIVTHVCNCDYDESLVRRQVEMRITEALESQRKSTDRQEKIDYSIKILNGSTVPLLMNLIDEMDIDILSIGSSGHNSFTHLFIGSTVSKIIRKAPCTIVVTPKEAVSQLASKKNSA